MNDDLDNDLQIVESQTTDTANDFNIMRFKRFSAWWVFLLATFTFGIYTIYWFYNRANTINEVSSSKISYYMLHTLLVFYVLSIAMDILSVGIEINDGLYWIITLTYFILYLAIVFDFRDQLQFIISQSTGKKVQLSGILTFFFNIIYLQYKINECIDNNENNKNTEITV